MFIGILHVTILSSQQNQQQYSVFISKIKMEFWEGNFEFKTLDKLKKSVLDTMSTPWKGHFVEF